MINKIFSTKNLFRLLMATNTGIVCLGIKEFVLDVSNLLIQDYIYDNSMSPLL
jgi:hypothetical protein